MQDHEDAEFLYDKKKGALAKHINSTDDSSPPDSSSSSPSDGEADVEQRKLDTLNKRKDKYHKTANARADRLTKKA